MAFSLNGLTAELKRDNPTYERVIRSDLHSLIDIFKKSPKKTAFSKMDVDAIAGEMKKVSTTKWLKYKRTRAYLEKEIPSLTDALRAVPIDFKTKSMTSQMQDTILRHIFTWKSDTGSLQDLSRVYTRENVSWPQWPQALTNCIGDAHGAYKAPGQHTGLATNPANKGEGQDDHALLGPFNQTVLDYNGPTVQAPMDQVYEYSHDKVTWHPIPNSTFSIVREVKKLPSGSVEMKLIKTNKTKPKETFTVRKTF